MPETTGVAEGKAGITAMADEFLRPLCSAPRPHNSSASSLTTTESHCDPRDAGRDTSAQVCSPSRSWQCR